MIAKKCQLTLGRFSSGRRGLLDSAIPYMVYIQKGMWLIYENNKTRKALEKLPKEILKRYEKWKDIVAMSGPQGLRMIKGFHDEALRGMWDGYRSSRLNILYRVLYRIRADEIHVEVLDITPHKY